MLAPILVFSSEQHLQKENQPSSLDLPRCYSEPLYIHAPACFISWPAWKITSLGLFWPACFHKAPPNPAACPQLIFLVATLLTAPPTDSGRRMSGGREAEERLLWLSGNWIEPQSASTLCFSARGDLSHLVFGINHPPSAGALYDTTSAPHACWPNNRSIQQLWVSLPVWFSTVLSHHPHNINQPAFPRAAPRHHPRNRHTWTLTCYWGRKQQSSLL